MIRNTRPHVATSSKSLDPEALRGRIEKILDPSETNPARSDTAPPVVVEILEPQDGSRFVVGDTIRLRASASDGSTDLGSEIRWHSSIDGFIGRRRAVRDPKLSLGQHTLSASIQLPVSRTAKSKSLAAATSEVKATVTVCLVDPTGYPDCDL